MSKAKGTTVKAPRPTQGELPDLTDIHMRLCWVPVSIEGICGELEDSCNKELWPVAATLRIYGAFLDAELLRLERAMYGSTTAKSRRRS